MIKTRMPLCVRDVMRRDVVTLPARALVSDAIDTLFEHRISGAPVVMPDGELVGVVSLVDLAASLPERRSHERVVHPHPTFYRDLWLDEDLDEVEVTDTPFSMVQDIMTPVVFAVDENDTLERAVAIMLEARIHRLIVTNEDGMVGILSTMDLIALLPDLMS